MSYIDIIKDKARMDRKTIALAGGADVVLELPSRYALSSAEGFAEGAVSLIDRLRVVDLLSFGSECGNATQLSYYAQRQLTLELNREPSDEELAKKMGITPEKVREVMKISQDPVSLETPIGEEEDSHLGDFVPDERSLSPEEYTTNEILKEEIKSVLSTLQPREQQVLELRFGLIDGTSYTLEEVGKRFNVTRERIRQIEAKALRKLRHPSRAKKLKDFMVD